MITPTPPLGGYEDLSVRYGDIHNHCALSYGHGSAEAAFRRARLQLDFASVTVHGAWPDPPDDDPALGYLVDYHARGFERARAGWSDYLRLTDAHDEPGAFVTLPSFEWHSRAYGDHCVYFRDGAASRIVDAPDLPALRAALASAEGGALLIPHHIGYRVGHRGLAWDAFCAASSPVVEIFSFHGSAESADAPYPYRHAMGPRHAAGTAEHGWACGHRFGVIGSSDHHNAFPGSHGAGRVALWARELTRGGIWEALEQRRSYALTGDRIALAVALDGAPMGAAVPAAGAHDLAVDVRAGGAIDYVEVLRGARVVHRESVLADPDGRPREGFFKIPVEVGWGEADDPTRWDVRLRVRGGELLGAEPRFRGPPATAQAGDPRGAEAYPDPAFAADEDGVRFEVATWPNPDPFTAATEGVCLEVRGDPDTVVEASVDGREWAFPLAELIEGPRSRYLGGFVSPALCLHRAVPEAEYARRFELALPGAGAGRVRVRVRQRNDQWAWSSPIWIDR